MSSKENSLAGPGFCADAVRPSYAHHRKRCQKIKIPTVNKLDTFIKQRRVQFEETLKPFIGTYFEQGDDSDSLTRQIQVELTEATKECDKLTKSSMIKKVVGHIPLPLFLPVMKDRALAVAWLDRVEYEVLVSTTGRKSFADLCTYAFQSEERLASLCEDKLKPQSDWRPEFQLFETASPERTWNILGYTEEGFKTWWRGRRSDTKVSDSWADLKSLCKCIVFVCDDIWAENMERLPHITRVQNLASQCREIAVSLVRQYSLHPEFARGISTIFGFTVPLVFALSTVVKKAKELLDNADAILSIRADHLLQRISELEPLIDDTAQWLKEFGAHLRRCPYTAAEIEDGRRLSYQPKPSIAQLFNAEPNELDGHATAIIIETGLAENEESLRAKVVQIQNEEIDIVGRQIVEESVTEEGPGYDVTVLNNLGLDEIDVSDMPLDMLGYGASAVVSRIASRTDPSRVYAIKHNKMYGRNATWNKVKKEARVWIGLKHDNILPLLGWCMHPTEQYPALVTPVCDDGSLNIYLHDHAASDRTRMRFLHDIISGLEYLHSQEVCHGDLRSVNILIDKLPSGDTRAVICDFGLSDFVGEVTDRLYQPAECQSTNDKWLAPELLFPNTGTIARVSKEADIYAFGCVILEVAFDKEPYDCIGSAMDQKRIGKLPACKTEMNEVYWPIAAGCWDYWPKKRLSASWIVSHLANLLREDS